MAPVRDSRLGPAHRQRGGRRRRERAGERGGRRLSAPEPPLLSPQGQDAGQAGHRSLGPQRAAHQEAPRRYGWNQARTLVLESFATLAPKFADAAEHFFEQPWIDAAPRAGKQSGAYSHPVTADRHPYVFLNYMGERRDVLTLAHELGHAVHQTLAAPRGTLLADTPLTLAETASIFGEGLVFERLLADASGEERKALLAGKIEDALNTVVRQIAFHRFETRFHDARATGEVSPEAIGAIWLEVMGESLGPAVHIHNIERPIIYVHTSRSLLLSLYKA